jgi:exodeoxyribonuclease-3
VDHVEAAVPGLHTTYDAGDRAGRNGVAVCSRSAPIAVRSGLGSPEFDSAGRWLEVDLDEGRGQGQGHGQGLTVVSVYVPTGAAGTPVQDAKHRFLDAVTARLAVLRATADAGGRQVIVGGDLNVAAEQADIRAWKANLRHSGFLPAERDWLRGLLADGWTDLVRAAHPDVAGPYSWWSWRGKAFDTDAGWRIDVLLATAGLAARTTAAWVDRAPSYAERISDHAPVLADLCGGRE